MSNRHAQTALDWHAARRSRTPQDADSMKAIEVGCQFCEQVRCKDALTSEGVRMALAAYVAHLVESHWDKLELGREMRLGTDIPINDAWTRL